MSILQHQVHLKIENLLKQSNLTINNNYLYQSFLDLLNLCYQYPHIINQWLNINNNYPNHNYNNNNKFNLS